MSTKPHLGSNLHCGFGLQTVIVVIIFSMLYILCGEAFAVEKNDLTLQEPYTLEENNVDSVASEEAENDNDVDDESNWQDQESAFDWLNVENAFKRSRLFVGKRPQTLQQPGNRLFIGKRSRWFVGKRPFNDHEAGHEYNSNPVSEIDQI